MKPKALDLLRKMNRKKEFFVHVTGLVHEVRENDRVTFELQEGRKGLNAVNVKKA